MRGNWKFEIVSRTDPEDDGKVRKVEVQHKNPKSGEVVEKYQGRDYVTVQRGVDGLIVLVPTDNKDEETNLY